MRHGRFWLAAVLFTSGTAVWWAAGDEPSPDEARELAVVKRFREVLEKNPRRGTALDRLYGFHVERGTLDQLIAEYAGRAKKDPTDGVAWMVVGLLESQRGKDAAAVAAFKQAEQHLPENPIPAYYLGQSLVLVGQPDAAAEAFERAITRKPNRADLLDVFQALGRVYQRGQRTDKALGVWNRLEALFPDDARVQEQIATTLVEEGQFDQALPRLEKLIKGVTEDKYRQATLRMDLAELKVKLKKTPDALADFEKLLAELNPDNWLYRDVRKRVEDVFLRNDDQAGLAKYYEAWVGKNPSDVDAIARLAKTLSAQGRSPEAKTWLEKGIAVAPTARGLRAALIDQYVFEQNFAAAAAQYEAMEGADPGNPDVLREWGKVLLRDTAKPEPDRKAAAVAVWKRILEKKPTDPVTAAQVADLMRAAGVTDEAVVLYKRAIDLAPQNAQYREYLGEFYHSLKRSEEAIATWRPIAEGGNRNAKNLTRLAEVFAGFGYRKEAVAAMADAISLEKDDFTMLMTYAELLHADGQDDPALKQLDAATKLVTGPEEAEQVLAAQIKVFAATEKLPEKIESLRKELDGGKEPTADRWHRLARYYEANRQADEAVAAVVAAAEKDPKSVPILTAAARIQEAGGNLLAAADANRKLAAIDRRFRTEYLQAVAKLEQRLGRRDQALQAGRDLLAASPGNPDAYKFYADLCFQLGEMDEGLEALRRSVRANPSDPQGLITLANAMVERVRQGEAIELLWRAFEKTTEMEGRLSIIDRLAGLYLENNQFDRLVERLERERREAEKARELTICLAQAYQSAGDLGTARAQLERLLTENTRDVGLLGQLSGLCETEGDVASALRYQRQLTAAAPNNVDHQLRLAQLLTKSGEADEAADIWVKLASADPEPHRNLSVIDQLLTAGKTDAAVAILSRLLASRPGDWELTYREGAALAAKGKKTEAAARFAALLALRVQDDELGAIAQNQLKQAKRKAAPGPAPRPGQPVPSARASRYDDPKLAPLTRRTQATYEIRTAVGMEQRYYYGGAAQPFYAPTDFGEARIAGLGWLYEFARDAGKPDAFVKGLKDARDKAGADLRPLWDWYYFQNLRNESGKDLLPTALTLSKSPDPAGLLAYINAVSNRTRGGSPRAARRGGEAGKDPTPPLPADQLAHLTACYRKLKQHRPEWVAAGGVTPVVMAELKRANKGDEEAALYRDHLAAANTPDAVRAALVMAVERNDLAATVELFTKLDRLQPPPKSTAQLPQLPTRLVIGPLETLMGKRAEAKQFADVLKLTDLYLTTARRQNLTTPRSTSGGRRASSGPLNLYFQNVKGLPRNASVKYPTPNEYYDNNSISALYCTYLLFKNADLTSDLFAHYRKQADAVPPAEKIYLQLALGYLHWWAEEKDEALARLAEAIATAPGDHNLLIEVASLREQNNEGAAALALLDSVTPVDAPMMQRREEAALRVAERTGNLDRARQAAERLFGLRLDADKQLELAGKMHRLGMPQMAEAVLNRAQRQAGNKTATLMRLMTQYQGQNQTDLAVQIARQILRRTPTTTPNPYRGGDESDQARTQAIAVLARSGQIKEMIERAEAQLKASPKSVQVHQSLAAYYEAAGDKEKLKATLRKLTELKPDDAKLRFHVARQLQQHGDRDAAIAEYKVAIKQEPALFGNEYWEIQRLFSEADKLEELFKVFDEIDLKKVGNYWAVTEPVAALLQNEKTRDLGLKLFKKAWDAFPQNRGSFLGRLYDESAWRMPEIYTYAKQAIIPREDVGVDSWEAVSEIMSYGGDGRVDGVITRLLSIARKQHRLPELRDELAAALAKKPDWVGGKALLGAVEVQCGNKALGRKLWEEAFADPRADVPATARFILTQELEYYAGMEETAVRTLEGGIDELMRDGNFEFSYGPARRLIWWYDHLGRKDDARKMLLKFAATDPVDPGYSGGYWQYRLVQNKISIAQELQRLGSPVEAIRLYTKLSADRDALAAAAQYGGDRYEQQVENGLREAQKALKADTLPGAVGALLVPRADAGPGKPAIDLVLMVDSHDLRKVALTSVFATAVRATDKAPDVRKDATAALAGLAKKYPNDFAVLTAAALTAFIDGKPTDTRAAVDRLAALADATPLEALPANGKPNARHRAEAAAQLPVWLVARECLAKGRDEYRAAGLKLADRAIAAARRQQDPFTPAAVLREWAQLDRDRGDSASAEAKLVEMLALVLPKSAAGTGAKQAVPVPTAGQFQHAYQVAELAAEWGMTGLSLRAIREGVRGGPPTNDKPNRGGGGGPYTQKTVNGVNYLVLEDSNKIVTIDEAVAQLVPKWRDRKVPAADVYDVLAAAVLPDARPAEVFLYGEGKQYSNVYKLVGSSWQPTNDLIDDPGEDRGLGRLLAEVAVEAGKVDDLRARAAARAGQPLGELPAKVLLANLALKAKDDARAAEGLKALGERIKTDSVKATNDRVADVLLPAFADPKFAPALLPYLVKAAENYAAAGDVTKAAEVRFKLAEYHHRRKDEATARAEYKAVAALGGAASQGAFDPHRSLAKEYLKVGWAEDALRELGLHADKATPADPANRGKRPEPTLEEFPQLVRLLLALPADKRYAALAGWSLPTAGRKSVRYYVGDTPKHVPPANFGPGPRLPADRVVSTMLLLADAAKEAGKLDELIATADKLAAEKVENAELLRVLVYLSAGKGKQIEPQIKAFAAAAKERMTPKPDDRVRSRYYYDAESQGPVPVHPSEYLFVTLCLADPALAGYGEGLLAPLLTRATETQNHAYTTRVRAAQDAHKAGRDAAALAAGTPPRWLPAGGANWFAQDGYAVANGTGTDAFLLLDAPLAGTFEFSVDFSEGSVGYAGVVYDVTQMGMMAPAWPVGKREQVYRRVEGMRADLFNRLTIQASPGKVRCLVNGKLFFEDTDPPPTSPWVMLTAGASRRPVFRNFALTGKPEVPAEVKLVAGDYLDGWAVNVYPANLPQRLWPKELAREGATDQYGNKVAKPADDKPPVYDWHAKGGELLGRRLDRPQDKAVPSALAYFRPLRPGESVRYEFFHDPGKAHVHPTLGRLAFLLEPGGVKLHYLTEPASDDWTGLVADHAVEDPAGKRADALPLTPGGWNALVVTATADGVRIDVNGTVAYEAALPPDVERTFGLFHYRDKTAARVRNVALTGPWAKTPPAAGDVALTAKPTTPAAAAARRRLLGERFYATEAGDVTARAKGLSPLERYKVLADWVLPTASRPSFQLAGESRPQDVLGVVDGKDQPAGRRVAPVSRFTAPCLEMVAAAREAGALDDLAGRIAKAEPPYPDDTFRRSKAALLGVVRAAQGRDADAAAALAELRPAAEQLKPDAGPEERWPDLIAVVGTIDRPALVPPALALAEAMNASLDKALVQSPGFIDAVWWGRAYRDARAAAQVAGLRPPPVFAHWAPYSAASGSGYGRSPGWNAPRWAFENGLVVHRAGHAEDFLVLRTPLRGDFEVSCELRLKKWQEARIRYGSYQFDLDADRKKYRMQTGLLSYAAERTITPPLPPTSGTAYRLTLAVKDGWLRATVDGQEVAAERIGAAPDPWLMISCPGGQPCEVKDLKIGGRPVAPTTVGLLGGDELGVWRAYAGESWGKRGEEMFHAGQKPAPPEDGSPLPPRSFPEAAVYYHRPLSEDGAVGYEFYYDPDKAHVHPALDRLVFLLDPDGVKLHWLTDGATDRSGVSFENVTDEPKCRRGPAKLNLKPKAWNAARLAVKGDTVTVHLNGELVYERTIEPTNQRTFGLFHYTDRTEARVRGIELTGSWPTQLPPAERLFEVKK